MAKSVAIVGSGIGGLAAAIRLAHKGYLVNVFEANSYPGGKLTEIRLDGYRFDAGPSLFTLPELIEDLFQLTGKNISDYFEYKKLDVTCNYFYPDGTELIAHADKIAFTQEVVNKLGEAPEKVERALEKSAFLYENLSPLFLHRSLHKSSTWFSSMAMKAYTKLSKFDFNRTMDQANRSRFSDPRTVQLFNRYATYNGSDPYQTPATLNIIPHLEFGIGAYFPAGGMHQITSALYKLAMDLGVKFLFNTPVKNIVVHEGSAKGVNTQMGFHKADRVVSNMDMVATYKHLLKNQRHPKKLMNQPKSSSALIFYWGIRQKFGNLDLHNIFFSQDYQKEFESIFKKKEVYQDPTVYINITSTQQTSDAPEGCQNWFTMINVPHNSGQDWDAIIRESRQNVLRKLSNALGADIEPLIEVEDILEPRTIESRTSSWQGALYGNSSNNKFSAFLRHPNFSSKIKNLYFCGGSVHPGGGIPLCLLSAKIMADNFS